MRKQMSWAPMMAFLLAACSSSTPMPPHLRYEEAVSKYGAPTHIDKLSDGGSLAVFQRKVEPATIVTYTLTFDAQGQCLEPKIEIKTNGKGPPAVDNLDESIKLQNVCYSHTFDPH